ncbi:hypothetical protein PTE30175_00256 [Pandoraea terrae]|uniref:Uncharacterized protein n=1 Tax=Pandoraea terrae TaxID=1537710 RepID=A0A5E4RMN1_9BURK|nr:hypothetical protein PTE30175_00256 [Pandoraea terrae]
MSRTRSQRERNAEVTCMKGRGTGTRQRPILQAVRTPLLEPRLEPGSPCLSLKLGYT